MNKGLNLLRMTVEDRRRRQLSDQESLADAQLVSVLERFEIDMCDDGPDTVADVDEPFEFEPLQDAAQRSSAHLELLRKLNFAERTSRLVFKQADPLADRPVDPLETLLGRFTNAGARSSVVFLHDELLVEDANLYTYCI
jgi:hypothetical protein